MNALYCSLKAVCERRKSVRDFADTPVPIEKIGQIKKIALTSPYASSKKNWNILTVDDKTVIQQMAEIVRKRLAQVQGNIKEDFAESWTVYTNNYFLAFEKAPVLFIPVFRTATGVSFMLQEPDALVRQWERDSYVKSISCVAMLILLAVESLGLGACYMTGPLFAEEELMKLLHIREGRNIGAIIPVGHPRIDD